MKEVLRNPITIPLRKSSFDSCQRRIFNWNRKLE